MIKNIIFDFGGVIIPIDPMAYAGGMIALGCSDIAGLHERFMEEKVYSRFETGQMSPAEFRLELRSGIDNHARDEDLDKAWNLIIGEIPPHRVKFLEELKPRYRTFLLSNTNKIHYDHYQLHVRNAFGYNLLDDLFERAYYSFQLGLYKPDPAIFEHVIKEHNLIPSETLFVDDFLVNIEAARALGLHVLHLLEGMEVAEEIHN
jgi:putative hydrolase of the HAD superfamily